MKLGQILHSKNLNKSSTNSQFYAILGFKTRSIYVACVSLSSYPKIQAEIATKYEAVNSKEIRLLLVSKLKLERGHNLVKVIKYSKVTDFHAKYADSVESFLVLNKKSL